MTPDIRPLVAGNWKMNGLAAAIADMKAMDAGYDQSLQGKLDLMVCPPATLLMAANSALTGSAMALGGQDCHTATHGAHTGDLSAEMLADVGASAIIVGHSERRADHGESNNDVRAKAQAAWRAGLAAIICIGETRAERDAGKAKDIVAGQLAGSVPEGATATNTVIAYEPVWAIGTGLTPTSDDVAAIHAMIRARLTEKMGREGQKTRILYGGSVKPANAAELMAIPNVDGALVGGASLKAADFLGIAAAYAEIA